MPISLSLKTHNVNLNEWAFSFTTKDVRKLYEAVSAFKKIHSHKLATSRVAEDPDVPSHYMFCGTCESKEDVDFTLMYMDNYFHEDNPIDNQYDYETDEA